MKKIIMLFVFGLMTQGVHAEEAATAQPSRGQVVDNRQERQAKRIENGVANGSLTEAEAKKLEHQQKRIKRMEKRAGHDGVVTDAEQKHLTHAQNNASRDIRRKKHNKRN